MSSRTPARVFHHRVATRSQSSSTRASLAALHVRLRPRSTPCEIAAVPGRGVPSERRSIRVAPFELVEHDFRETRAIVHAHHLAPSRRTTCRAPASWAARAARVRARSRPARARASAAGRRSPTIRARSCHHHFAEHARFHVIEQMAVIRPAPERVRGDAIADRCAGCTTIVCLRARNSPSGVSSSLHMPCRWIGCVIIVSLTSTMRSALAVREAQAVRRRRISRPSNDQT